MLPVLVFTAMSSPHGGAEHEYRVFGSQKRPPSGVTLRKIGPLVGGGPAGSSSGLPAPAFPPDAGMRAQAIRTKNRQVLPQPAARSFARSRLKADASGIRRRDTRVPLRRGASSSQ